MGNQYAELRNIVQQDQERFQSEVQSTRKGYRKLIRSLEIGDPTFKVVIGSYWKDSGEKDVEVIEQGPLEKILGMADLEFNKVNHRADEQRSHSVFLVAENVQIPIPKELYADYLTRNKYSQ